MPCAVYASSDVALLQNVDDFKLHYRVTELTFDSTVTNFIFYVTGLDQQSAEF